jgi:hypothetical protein
LTNISAARIYVEHPCRHLLLGREILIESGEFYPKGVSSAEERLRFYTLHMAFKRYVMMILISIT